jgi:hypothetical protein
LFVSSQSKCMCRAPVAVCSSTTAVIWYSSNCRHPVANCGQVPSVRTLDTAMHHLLDRLYDEASNLHPRLEVSQSHPDLTARGLRTHVSAPPARTTCAASCCVPPQLRRQQPERDSGGRTGASRSTARGDDASAVEPRRHGSLRQLLLV